MEGRLESLHRSHILEDSKRGSIRHRLLMQALDRSGVDRVVDLHPSILQDFKLAFGEVLAPEVSRAYLPLRSCQGLFASGPEAVVGTAKRAALLYDVVVFEPGSVFQHIPPNPTCDFGPGVLEELRMHDFDWVQEFQNPAQTALGKDLCSEALFGAGLWNQIVPYSSDGLHDGLKIKSKAWWAREAERGRDRWQGALFAADFFGGVWLEASVLTTGPFAEMTRAIRGGSDAGAQSAEILLPDLHSLPWEAIAEFRSHPACEDARSRLRQWEIAARNDPERAEAQSVAILRGAMADFASTIDELRPRLPDSLAHELAEFGLGLIPVVGQMAASIGSISGAVMDHWAWNGSWQSAFVQLMQQPREQLAPRAPDDQRELKEHTFEAIRSTWPEDHPHNRSYSSFHI